MESPYLVPHHELVESNEECRVRHAATLRFLRKRLETPGFNAPGTALDIGERNPFTETIESVARVSIQNTTGDLDFVELSGSYDLIFSFEVLEHLFNPLWHLRQLKKCLAPDGRIFLSTPQGKPHFLWSPQHFHEMHESELRVLVTQAGLCVTHLERIRVHDMPFYFTGLRPFLRLFFERVFLMELRHAPASSKSGGEPR